MHFTYIAICTLSPFDISAISRSMSASDAASFGLLANAMSAATYTVLASYCSENMTASAI